MKAFVAALAVFALLIGGSVIHALCLERISERLFTMEASFPEKKAETNAPDPAIRQAEAYWNTVRDRLVGTVNMRYLNAVSNALRNVIDYYEEGSVSDYEASRSLLREAVETLRLSDKVGFASVI